MAVTNSPRLGLTRWSVGTDPFTRAQMETSHAALEALAAGFLDGTRPAAAASNAKMFHYNSGTGRLSYSDGTTWRDVPKASDYESSGAVAAHAAASDPHGDRSFATTGTTNHNADSSAHSALNSRFLGASAKAADSNLLDGIDSSGFMRSNTSDSFTSGTLTMAAGTALAAQAATVSVATPSSAAHAASKSYVDARDKQFHAFNREGVLTTFTGAGRLPLPFAVTVLEVRLTVDTAPTGSSITVDVNKNGTTLLGATKAQISAGQNSGTRTGLSVACAANDYLTIDVDQVGSTNPGEDLTVIVVYAPN